MRREPARVVVDGVRRNLNVRAFGDEVSGKYLAARPSRRRAADARRGGGLKANRFLDVDKVSMDVEADV
jgi:hypothetical protein